MEREKTPEIFCKDVDVDTVTNPFYRYYMIHSSNVFAEHMLPSASYILDSVEAAWQ